MAQYADAVMTVATRARIVSSMLAVALVAGSLVVAARPALAASAGASAWGDNESGQVGDGTTGDVSRVPVAVSGLSEVTAVAGGAEDSLALLGSGTVMAWGDNEDGQLGDGTTTSSDVPVAVNGLSEVSAIGRAQRISH